MPSPDPLASALAPITTLVTDWALWMIPLVLFVAALKALFLLKLPKLPGRWLVGIALLVSTLSLATLSLRLSTRMAPPAQTVPTAAVANVPAVIVPHSAVVEYPLRQVAPAAQVPTPPLLEWTSPPPAQQQAERSDCNTAIAAVLADNSQQNRRRRDRACGRPTPVPTSTTP